VREIDEHAEPVHLADDAIAEGSQPAVLRRIERGVGPIERDVVRQRHVPNAQIVVRPKGTERVLDCVAAFEAKKRSELPLLEVVADVVGAQRQREPIGILRDDPPGDVDLLQLNPGVARVTILARRVHRPELRADHSTLQAIEIRVPGRVLAYVVRIDVSPGDGIFADAPGKVVVPVDQRRFAQDPLGSREVASGWSGGGLSLNRDDRGHGKQQQTGNQPTAAAIKAGF
jgi:hypothetical protein